MYIPIKYLIYEINCIVLNNIVFSIIKKTETIDISKKYLDYLNKINKNILMGEIIKTILESYNKNNYINLNTCIKNTLEGYIIKNQELIIVNTELGNKFGNTIKLKSIKYN